MKAKWTKTLACVMVCTSCLVVPSMEALASGGLAGIQRDLVSVSTSDITPKTVVLPTATPEIKPTASPETENGDKVMAQAGVAAELAQSTPAPQDAQVPAPTETGGPADGAVTGAEDAPAIEPAGETSEWSNRLMAKVDDSLNIRAEASEESELVGKLFKGGAADILERGDEWTKISSGSVEGYVKNDYVAFDAEAEALAEEEAVTTATVNTETLKVRSEASTEASVLGLAANGQQYTVTGQDDEWVTVEFGSEQTGYVAKEYVTVEVKLGEAKSVEQIAEEQRAAEAEKAKQNGKNVTQKEAVSANADEATILAAIIQMEAGNESFEGKLGVASVVMNRVRSGRYPGSISGVVYQSGQFPPAHSDRMQSIIANGPSGSCMEAAQAAIGGADNVGGATQFRPASSGADGTVIGNHVFW